MSCGERVDVDTYIIVYDVINTKGVLLTALIVWFKSANLYIRVSYAMQKTGKTDKKCSRRLAI